MPVTVSQTPPRTNPLSLPSGFGVFPNIVAAHTSYSLPSTPRPSVRSETPNGIGRLHKGSENDLVTKKNENERTEKRRKRPLCLAVLGLEFCCRICPPWLVASNGHSLYPIRNTMDFQGNSLYFTISSTCTINEAITAVVL